MKNIANILNQSPTHEDCTVDETVLQAYFRAWLQIPLHATESFKGYSKHIVVDVKHLNLNVHHR